MVSKSLVRACLCGCVVVLLIMATNRSTYRTHTPDPSPLPTHLHTHQQQPPTRLATTVHSAQHPHNTTHATRTQLHHHPNNANLPDVVGLHLDDPTMFHAPALPDSDAQLDLQDNLVPAIVHYLWCGERWFEFTHYMSILSTIRAFKPTKIVFHYEMEPVMDRVYYNQWLEYLQHDYQFFYMDQLSSDDLLACTGNTRSIKVNALLDITRREGGLFIGENTWLIDFDIGFRELDVVWALDDESLEGFYLLRREAVADKQGDIEQQIKSDDTLASKKTTCAALQHLPLYNLELHCLYVLGRNVSELKPMHIWDREDSFGRVARTIFYGQEKILRPQPSYDELVPNIGHMVWIGGGRVDFVFYLSVLSMLYIVKVDMLYIHGDQEPTGDNWAELKATQTRVKFVYRPEPRMVYQNPIEPRYRALMSDVIRVDLMIKYGGIYCDTDAIWVKPLTLEDRGYDATATYDWIDWSYPYPDSVNFGVSYGKRNAPFWRVFRNSMRVLHNKTPGFTGVMNPYKLLERHPDLLRIDKRLSVICYELRCHPLWVRDYHNETNNHVTTNSIPDWKHDVHAFHWTYPNPPELADRESLLQAEGMFAELGKYVLQQAGLYNPEDS